MSFQTILEKYRTISFSERDSRLCADEELARQLPKVKFE